MILKPIVISHRRLNLAASLYDVEFTVVFCQINVGMGSFLTNQRSTFSSSHTLICSSQALDDISSAKDRSSMGKTFSAYFTGKGEMRSRPLPGAHVILLGQNHLHTWKSGLTSLSWWLG
jgi:hypothetical protein